MDAINELAEALAAAQGAFQNPERNRKVEVQTRTGGTYTFMYATLDTIMDAIRKPLADNKLSVTHTLERQDGAWLCVTRLLHASGQSIECPVPIVVHEDADAQGWGSALTYARRYGLCTLLGIAAEEDDDGNSAAGNYARAMSDKERNKGLPQGGFAPSKKSPSKKPKEHFSWDKANSEARTAYIVDAVDRALKLPDPVESQKKLEKISEWMTTRGGDVALADLETIRDKLLGAENQLQQEASGQ